MSDKRALTSAMSGARAPLERAIISWPISGPDLSHLGTVTLGLISV